MANDLILPRELALWTQTPLERVEGDDFAAEVMDKVSQMAKFLAGQPLWTYETAPFDVKMVVLQVCKRSYQNPNQVIQEGSVGPIGGDRILEAAALLTNLTDSERATLEKHNPGGSPDGLWVMSTTTRHQLPSAERLYVGDNQQINLELSNDPREWMIPMFNPGDPGSPTLYPDEE